MTRMLRCAAWALMVASRSKKTRNASSTPSGSVEKVEKTRIEHVRFFGRGLTVEAQARARDCRQRTTMQIWDSLGPSKIYKVDHIYRRGVKKSQTYAPSTPPMGGKDTHCQPIPGGRRRA